MNDLIHVSIKDLNFVFWECTNELSYYKTLLITLLIERDNIKRKIEQLKEEKEILEIIKSGSDFNESLVNF